MDVIKYYTYSLKDSSYRDAMVEHFRNKGGPQRMGLGRVYWSAIKEGGCCIAIIEEPFICSSKVALNTKDAIASKAVTHASSSTRPSISGLKRTRKAERHCSLNSMNLAPR